MEKLNSVGEKHINNDGENFTIIEYFNARNITIQFTNCGTIVKNKHYNNIESGGISNPNNLFYGIGYLGIGKYSKSLYIKGYGIWTKMLQRCYSEKFQLKNPSYVGCTVDERWYNFQIFAEWCEANYIDGFVLDKDILVKGNKIYGPDTCCFVPQEINNLFIKPIKTNNDLPIGVSINNKKFQAKLRKFGKYICLGTFPTPERAFNVYKSNKEFYILQMANLWKPKIPSETYQAMINYKVEITD